MAEGSRKAGTKGGGITLGVLILNFLTGGAAIAMFSVLKSYFERNSSIEMEFQRADGNKLKIKAENVRSDQIEHTMESARDFFGVA